MAKYEYCLIVNGNNIDCYQDENTAIENAFEFVDGEVKVLLVEYDENENEIGIETIWER